MRPEDLVRGSNASFQLRSFGILLDSTEYIDTHTTTRHSNLQPLQTTAPGILLEIAGERRVTVDHQDHRLLVSGDDGNDDAKDIVGISPQSQDQKRRRRPVPLPPAE